jgi:hypothetical protein
MLEIGGRDDVRLARNNAGVATYPDGSVVRYGCFRGGADCLGIQRVLITPLMVGRHIGRLVAIETKSEHGVVSEQQRNFLNMVRAFGGVAVVARSVADVEQALDGGLFDR